MSSIWLVSLIFVGISMLVSLQLKAKFASYGKMRLPANLTGKEVAEKCFGIMVFMMCRLYLPMAF